MGWRSKLLKRKRKDDTRADASSPTSWRYPKPIKMSFGVNLFFVLVISLATAFLVGATLWVAIGRPSLRSSVAWTAQDSFNFLKIVLSVIGGLGGMVALVVSYRKQRNAEAAENREDNRLVSEEFSVATEKLGSDSAPVRLAGIYALERIGQNNPTQRQVIANVLCAYLRMPFHVDEQEWTKRIRGDATNEDAVDVGVPQAATDLYDFESELQVRETAQRIIKKHLYWPQGCKNPPDSFWGALEVDLSGATLVDFSLSDCRIQRLKMPYTKLVGLTGVDRSAIHDQLDMRNARICSGLTLQDSDCRGGFTLFGAHLKGPMALRGTKIEQYLNARRVVSEISFDFHGVIIDGDLIFASSISNGLASFSSVTVKGGAFFTNSSFNSSAFFDQAIFEGFSVFSAARFNNKVNFSTARFSNGAYLDGYYETPENLSRFALTEKDLLIKKASFTRGYIWIDDNYYCSG